MFSSILTNNYIQMKHVQPKWALWLCAAMLCATACKRERNEDVTETVDRQGAVESALQVQHIDSTHDVLITTHRVWKNNNEVKTIVYTDTLPSLGQHTTEAENEEGETRQVQVPKEYQLFITVK
jgi:hypothetical protein